VKQIINTESGHVPVLLEESIHFLAPKDGGVYIDATFGGGGHSEAILKAAKCSVIALDRDEDAAKRAISFSKKYIDRFSFFLSNFSQIDSIIGENFFDGILFDFGVSSFQLEDVARGFSFQVNGPLDMRMGNSGLTAGEVINSFKEEEIFQIIKFYGEERFAKRISHDIVNNRPINTTFELANIVRSVIPKVSLIDPATKTFQAFRIFVNDELKEIDIALSKIENLVIKNKIKKANIVTIAFHSLEDRIVKNWIRKNQSKKDEINEKKIILRENVRKVVVPRREEQQKNPRSRSARLRAVTLEYLGEKE
jgi:16S rRNA (cytosine1402-N4)-methyltransferase